MSLKIDSIIKELITADRDTACFIDKKTGEFFRVSAVNPDLKLLNTVKEKMKTGNLLQVPKYSSKENFVDMAEFIKNLKDVKLAQQLRDALESGGNASKFFRDALRSPKHSLVKEKWESFQKERIRQHILSFLKSSGIVAV